MAKQHDSQLATALDLVGRVYEAAAEADLWPQFLNAIADATDCEGTIIWLQNASENGACFRDTDDSFIRNVRIEPEFLKSYAEHYVHTNILVKGIDDAPEGVLMSSSALVPDAQLHKTEYYADWLRPQGVGYCIGGPVLKRGSDVAIFSLSRLKRRGPFADSDLRLMQLLMPHLRRACLLHQRLTRLRAERSGGLAGLDLLTTAVWLLDADGRLLFANAAGRELDARRDGLWIERDGRPTATDLAERQTLQRCIAATIAAGKGLGVASDCALRIRRCRQCEPLQVMLYPLGRDVMQCGSAAAMFIFDPAKSLLAETDAFRVFYGLTPAEARLACALARGATVNEYCVTHRLAANTVRTHLKRALAKTGTHQQSQLVSLVAKFPAARGS